MPRHPKIYRGIVARRARYSNRPGEVRQAWQAEVLVLAPSVAELLRIAADEMRPRLNLTRGEVRNYWATTRDPESVEAMAGAEPGTVRWRPLDSFDPFIPWADSWPDPEEHDHHG